MLIVEKAEAFDAKVGEATTEMSAMFLTRRLAMWHHLEAEQLPKEGLRYWFTNDKVTGHANATEARRLPAQRRPVISAAARRARRVPAGDRGREGAELLRPAKARDVELGTSTTG